MKKMAVALVATLILFSSAGYAAAYDGEALQQALFASLLLDDDMDKSRLGVRSIRRIYADKQDLSDLIAEQLVRSTKTEPSLNSVNTVSWYIIVLGEFGDPRYREVLNATRQRITNQTLLAHIDKALAAIGAGTAVPYVIGSIDVLSKQASLKQLLASNRTADRKAFVTIGEGASLVQMLDILGVPDDVTSSTAGSQRLVAHYAGAGLVFLSISNTIPHQWLAVSVMDELLPVSNYYTGDGFWLAQILGCLEGKPLVKFYKSNARRIRADVDALGIIAYRAMLLPYPDDDYDRAMLQIGLKQLARSSDPKGIALVRKVAAMPRASKAKKVAANLVRWYEKRALGGKEATRDDEDDLVEKDVDSDEKEEQP